MQLNRISLLFCGILVILFVGCKKNSDDEVKYSLKFSPKALEYMNLTSGKYLIYKDSATSLLDSVIVTTSKLETFFSEKYQSNFIVVPGNYNEHYSLVLTKYIGGSHSEWLSASAGLSMANMPFPFASSDTCAAYMTETDNTVIFNFAASDQPNLTMTVEGKTYNNVVVTYSSFGGTINDSYFKNTVYYWAKGIGIIKSRVITTGGAIKTYTLLRNN